MIESCELIIRQPGHPERVVRLQDGVTRLGRAEDNDVVLSDVGVSRRHARVVVGKDAVRVEDLGSGNGSYYRGFRVQSQQLDDGDEIVVDPFVLQFRIKGAAKRQGADSNNSSSTGGSGGGARLEVIAGSGMARTTYPIPTRGLTIGRSETRDVVIPDPAASRHHCTILARDNTWVLRDMGSANGVHVNGNRVRESLLADGDRVRIGNTEMRFSVGDPGQIDSNTQKMNRDPWTDGWTQNEMSLPVPESPTPRANAGTSPRIAQGGGPSVLRVLVGVAGLAMVFVVIFTLAFVVFLGGYLVLRTQLQGPTIAVREPSAPEWKLDLPPGLAQSDTKTLQEQGITALRSGDEKKALESFWRVLRAEPGKASAERLAYASGEYLLLDDLQKQLQIKVDERSAREKKRDGLLGDVKNGSAPKKRAATDTLVKEFRDDPVVVSTLGWTPSPAMISLDTDLTSAAELANQDQWPDAARKYADVLARSQAPKDVEAARAGFKASRRELAREVSAEWTAGVLSEVQGDAGGARTHFQRVVAIDPDNASARLRLGRLGPGDGKPTPTTAKTP